MTARSWAVALLAAAMAAMPAAAQSPLERRISLHVRDVALRDALDRIAAAGNFKLSYSGDNLPLDRRVSVWRDTTRVSDVLDELLRSFPVTAVALPDDQVVLTPRAPEPRDTVARFVTVLDRVVVTGSAIGAPERSLPIALDVVAGRDVERRGQGNLSEVFDGSVPGVWMWEQAPTAMLGRYASIRGASSFGVSSPKVYVDGIEVANPLLLTQITPERIERIEVIRGPQGAALYGTDAISGVVNIISRNDGGSGDGSHLMLRSDGGYAAGYGAGATAVQRHHLSARAGSNLRSANGSVGFATSGAYIPEAYSREFRASGNARAVGTMSTLTASAHYFGKNAGVPMSPLLGPLNRFQADSGAQKLRMYTIGSTITAMPSDRWTYAITGGVDGYALANVSSELGPLAFFVDSALRDARGSALRATMRGSAVGRAGSSERFGATFTFASEHSTLRDRSLQGVPTTGPGSGPGAATDTLLYVTEWSSNMGFTSQVDLAFRNSAYLTAGVRQERVSRRLGISQFRSLPMLGGALVKDFAGMTAKARVAYGKGIRALDATQRARTGEAKRRLQNPLLEPEEQSGIEGGIDLLFGSRAGVHVTRFDQLAFGLIQDVMVVDSSGPPSAPPRYWYQLQNVGRISNRGWEAQASANVGALSVSGALTTVDSRVNRLSNIYTGDLRQGDRMLGVPARTLTGTVGWTRRGFHASTTVARASDWVNYDRLAIAQCYVAMLQTQSCTDAKQLDGPTLRKYWKAYDGNTRVRATTSFDLRRGVMLTLTGENLLNYQRGEPDSITIVPGRTITAGVRARF
jgi:iron complex outermembrane receptor protein